MDRVLIERKAPRFHAQVRIFFTVGDTEGEGVVLDLSKDGCRVRCESRVTPGAELQAQIFFPDYEWPLKIERAVVRWVTDETFGMEFVAMWPAQRSRLRGVLAEKKFRSGSSADSSCLS